MAMTSIFEIILSTWRLFEKMAPYLLLGFFVAGLLRALLPEQMVVRHLSKKGFSSILKASLIGVPLPLCSCGVLPVATHLRKQGANNGAAVSFLVSTPSTGVDSLFASYALLGPIFAVIRPVYSLTAGVLAGLGTHSFGEYNEVQGGVKQKKLEDDQRFFQKFRGGMEYGFGNLIKDISKWLLIGVAIGGLINWGIPDGFAAQYLPRPILAYPAMILIGIPMYVCATGSIPIAAALVAKGISPRSGVCFFGCRPCKQTLPPLPSF